MLAKITPSPVVEGVRAPEEQVDAIAKKFREIMEILGLNLQDDSLRDTPERVAKMWVYEICSGLRVENFPKVSVIENKMNYDQMIVSKKVGIISLCEHHFQTIDGFATIAYIPSQRVIGLSKINRIAKFFSRRPQVQERLTKQIADCLELLLETAHVAVHIEARHYCLISRGVEDASSWTATCDLRGDFKKKLETRTEFLRHCVRPIE